MKKTEKRKISVHQWFQTGLREEKALAEFGANGHSESYIQSTQTTHLTRP